MAEIPFGAYPAGVASDGEVTIGYGLSGVVEYLNESRQPYVKVWVDACEPVTFPTAITPTLPSEQIWYSDPYYEVGQPVPEFVITGPFEPDVDYLATVCAGGGPGGEDLVSTDIIFRSKADDPVFSTPTADAQWNPVLRPVRSTITPNVNESTCEVFLEWRVQGAGSWGSVALGMAPTYTSEFSYQLSGLTPGEVYEFRFRTFRNGVTGGGEDSYSEVSTFENLLGVEVATQDATRVKRTQARLWGRVSTNNATYNSEWSFEYGTDSSYGSETTITEEEINGDVQVSFILEGLLPVTTYHFRVKFIIDGQTFLGEDKTFMTTSDDEVLLYM